MIRKATNNSNRTKSARYDSVPGTVGQKIVTDNR